MNDGQSISLPWCQAPNLAHKQILVKGLKFSGCLGAASPMRGQVCPLSGVTESAINIHLQVLVFT
jgi:hypothetical protein